MFFTCPSIHLRWIPYKYTHTLGGATKQIRKHRWGKSHVETLPSKSLSVNASGFSEVCSRDMSWLRCAAANCNNSNIITSCLLTFNHQNLARVHLIRILTAEAARKSLPTEAYVCSHIHSDYYLSKPQCFQLFKDSIHVQVWGGPGWLSTRRTGSE